MTTDLQAPEADTQHSHDCENCGTALVGEYCHLCGQHAHNPLKSLKHAVEEVFESVWHLDGRIFRTLRDICVPGRASINYLAGKRARYLPPLRIFFILSLFTFFLAHIAMPEDLGPKFRDDAAFAEQKTVADVVKARDTALASLKDVPEPARTLAIDRINTAADNRIAVLGDPKAGVDRSTSNSRFVAGIEQEIAEARAKPFRSAWMPVWYDHAVQSLRLRMMSNLGRFAKGDLALGPLWLSSVPTALFFMVPIFALLLRIVYIRHPISWLEHLVVALFSHAHLLMLSAVLLLFAILAQVTGSTVVATLTGYLIWVALAWAVVYLYLSQLRIYRQSKGKTTLKFLVLGFAHFNLLVLAATTAAILMFLK